MARKKLDDKSKRYKVWEVLRTFKTPVTVLGLTAAVRKKHPDISEGAVRQHLDALAAVDSAKPAGIFKNSKGYQQLLWSATEKEPTSIYGRSLLAVPTPIYEECAKHLFWMEQQFRQLFFKPYPLEGAEGWLESVAELRAVLEDCKRGVLPELPIDHEVACVGSTIERSAPSPEALGAPQSRLAGDTSDEGLRHLSKDHRKPTPAARTRQGTR